MLLELSIRNFAIIDDIRIAFSDGFTLLSGETGAGKSIIVNAVNLLLGSRASSKLVRTGENHAELEALFEIPSRCSAEQIMIRSGFDPSEGLMIRRIISRDARHRIYINNKIASMQLLSSITENLASISGQHAHQGLLKEDRHLAILDQFGGLTSIREKIFKIYHEIVPLIKALKRLKKGKRQYREKMELLLFQKNEIVSADIIPDEDITLENERLRLKNAELLYRTAYEGIEAIYGSDNSIVDQLAGIEKDFQKAGRIDPELNKSLENISQAVFTLQDLSDELRNYLSKVEVNDARLLEVEDRLEAINLLKRKYGPTLSDVKDRLEGIQEELEGIDNSDSRIQEIESQLEEKKGQLVAVSRKLSEKRAAAARVLSGKVEAELTELKMGGSRFQIDLSRQTSDKESPPYLTIDGSLITESGFDRACFMMSANIGEAIKPLAAIASGGELSRVVLALKAILAKTDAVGTIVFDEVDAGIGGGAAEMVGRKLASLSRKHQVICITHLAQIAKFGDHHFKINKMVSKGRTTTSIAPVQRDDRVAEIARMMGGERITEKTLEHAREMIGEN